MRLIFRNFCHASVFGLLAAATNLAQAELKPLMDEELSELAGQAAIAMEIQTIGGDSYTRITMGMEIDMQMNVDVMELGQRNIPGETLGADIDIRNLGFGSISENSTQVQIDGLTYAVNDIVPFEFNDPFIELATDTATGELKGFRFGFREARGQLSGDFNSISGNIAVDITDFFGDDYRSSMLNDAGDADNFRSRYFGVSKAETGGATSCAPGGGFYCYDLANYKSFDVGKRNTATGGVDYTNDFFFSYQKAPTNWQTSEGMITTGTGAHINIPTALHIDMNTGTNASGTERPRTEYIDRGNGLF